MNQTLNNVIGHALIILIKHRDKHGLQYYSQNLAKEINGADYVEAFNSFFQTYAENLTQEDIEFFESLANEFIDENKPPAKPKQKKKKVNDEKHMKNIKKTMLFLKKKMGWELGSDYSFLNGNIYMSNENKKKLRETMSK